jgi:signal transduction histidine kinase
MLQKYLDITEHLAPIALIMGIVFAVTLIGIIYDNYIDNQKIIFDEQVLNIRDSATQKLNAIEESIHGIRTLFDASKYVDIDEFKIMSSGILGRHNFIHSVLYIPMVTNDKKKAFESLVSKEHHLKVVITQHENGKPVPADARARYLPVKYQEPFELENNKKIGLDYFSEHPFKAFITQAIETGAIIASMPDTDNHQDSGYTVFRAIYTSNTMPEQNQERWQIVRGIVAMRINVEKLLEGITIDSHSRVMLGLNFSSNKQQTIGLAVRNGEHVSRADSSLARWLDHTHDITVGKQIYSLKVKKTLHIKDAINRIMVAALIIGIAVTILLVVLAKNIMLRANELRQRNREVKELASLRTQELADTNAELLNTTVELKNEKDEQHKLIYKLQEAHNQLLHSEKMASIGQLAAGVAHEINNPIGYVNSNLGSLRKYVTDLFRLLDLYEQMNDVMQQLPETAPTHKLIMQAKQDIDFNYLKEDLACLIYESQEGLNRVTEIVQNLKDFSHADKPEWQWADIHNGLNSTLNIVHNEIKYHVEVIKEYGDLPLVECLAPQLNQVFMNMLVNAAHAIEGRGTITIRTGTENDKVWIEFSDTGKGIQTDQVKNIFDPFFTTKPIGKGTGLGLSLSYGIIKKHNGNIEVESEIGKGTSFRIWLPIKQKEIEQ